MIDEKNIDEFELFLKNQTDKHRMYPSDQIWRNINQQLHGNSRWPALTFAAILTGALLTAGLIFLHPNKDLFKQPILTNSETPIHKNSATQNLIAAETPSKVDITRLEPVNDKTVMYSFNLPEPARAETYIYAKPTNLPEATELLVSLTEPVKSDFANGNINNSGEIIKNLELKSQLGLIIDNENILSGTSSGQSINDNDAILNNNGQMNINASHNNETNSTDQNINVPEIFSEGQNEISKRKSINRFSINIYGGSNISYRRLSEPASFDYHFPYNTALTSDPRKNVNKLVTQRAAVGFEFGTALAYAISDRLRLRAGVQFNFRQYNIDAYKTGFEPAILLMSNSATSSTDSVMVYSTIRNGEGNNQLTLQNRYYQIGLPIGLEWTFAESKKVNISFGATIQPTYQLNTDMYMLTSDYKNYVQQPDMVRRWNFNAGVEAMANFNAGGLKWQVGPQLKYQMMPTQSKNYSVHERLIDYGVKVGIIKQIK